MRTRTSLLVVAAALATLTACTDSPAEREGTGQVPRSGSSEPTTPSSTETPQLKVETVAGGLSHGWDIGFLPDGKILVSQRPARIALLSSSEPGATVTDVKADLSDVLVQGEGGLMGLVVHPDFEDTRRFTTCQTHTENGQPTDIRLVTWRLADDGQIATREKELLTGLPLNPSGRHSGCRPTLARDGALLVGTGDTARGNFPQDRTNLGGKVLRLDLETGEPKADNPFIGSANRNERYVHTYGHRNIQGVALRPDSDQVFTAEHGPGENDEVNLVQAGKNYGWDPSQGGTVGGYDEGVDMTDLQRFPDAVSAKWQTGAMTEAVCAATFLDGDQWGALNGALVITALKGEKVVLLSMKDQGDVTTVAVPKEFTDTFGRLRAARTGPDGALYLTTSNGTDDKLLRVTPA
ncbi:PQQ-dependent sugar dehydrogenase [Actinophytocola algeriensis]|uniref:Glucose/arabinose dehydrogenase n=1 Tax=Actinophytocola algeriensis TaxID=1768010 RepID=A0A7W7QD37_9PSEU|nr:PQQ-dependent sugar dehydrogenase [Actinophytocola algeriensis]MBB4911213.1 glucose/arabinose dehydrogenase [Actinophytocola algeriensis]MBE1479152.1 glucose/arabinose dehydrogenase [Actinophytocola algeriensis]